MEKEKRNLKKNQNCKEREKNRDNEGSLQRDIENKRMKEDKEIY